MGYSALLVSACNKVYWIAVGVMVHSIAREVTFGFRVARYPITWIYNQLKKILEFDFGFMEKAVRRLPNRLVCYQGILEWLCHASCKELSFPKDSEISCGQPLQSNIGRLLKKLC